MAQITRICLTGPECTGKSKLAERLAAELGTVCAPEFAREYALRVRRQLGPDDVEPIATGQIAIEERFEPQANAVLVLDTDLISTVVYARHYYGYCPQWIERAARTRRADLYLLLDTDLEWLPDPARDASAPDIREDLFDAFRAALDEFDTHWQIISGPWEERWAAVRAAVGRAKE